MTALMATTKPHPYVCKRSDSVFAAIEKCLDNGIESCFVTDDDDRLLGQVTLSALRRLILDGTAFGNTHLEDHVLEQSGGPQTIYGFEEDGADDRVLTPILDFSGRLIGVELDRSRQFVQVAKPDLSRHELRAVLDAFVSSWISSKGAYIDKLERDFAVFAGTGHGIAVSNGTVALHLALLALDIGPGDEVIVPDLTFIATINAVLHCGATPVIVDVDPATWCLSADKIAAAITPRTKAVIPVHIYGRPAEMGPIVALAEERGIHVIEDCAEAHGARYAGRPVGHFGTISCFSFYANKVITTGEGGMCVTRSEALANKMRLLRDHGIPPNRGYTCEQVGYNYRMTNIQAAIGTAQLRRADCTLKRNQRLLELYRERFRGVPGVRFQAPLGMPFQPITWLICIQVPAELRTALIEAAYAAEIEMRPFFPSLSSMPIYQKFASPCPVSAALSAAGLNLPTSRAVDRRVVDKLVRVFRDVLA